jgi:hypothetical protein
VKVSELSPKAEFVLVRSRAAHELGPGAECEACGEIEPLMLGRFNTRIVCLECEAVRRGASPYHDHHIGGRAPGTRTVLVGANVHAVLTLLQTCFWKGRYEPGSSYAVAFDLAAYLAYVAGTGSAE